MDRHEPNGNPHPSGCNSTASLAVPNACAEPPAPPGRLSAEEQDIWLETTQSVRPDWFRGSETLLETFCRAVAVERRLASLLREAEPVVDEVEFASLARLHRAEVMAVAALATRLRLTVRSLRERDTRRLPRAWEDVDDPLPS
jgi:hypothetical protein